jgi:hypothetical protein
MSRPKTCKPRIQSPKPWTSAPGYKREYQEGADSGESTPDCGSRSPAVGDHEDLILLTPDSGRGFGVALTVRIDPKATSRKRE